jgi:hypothetical protein
LPEVVPKLGEEGEGRRGGAEASPPPRVGEEASRKTGARFPPRIQLGRSPLVCALPLAALNIIIREY